MSDPTGGSRDRHRANADRRLGKSQMTEEDSLNVEAYGARGAAMRKTMGKMAEGEQKAETSSSGIVSKVKKFFGGA